MLTPLALRAIISRGGHTLAAMLMVVAVVAELTASASIMNAYISRAYEAVEIAQMSRGAQMILLTPSNQEFMEITTLDKLQLNTDIMVTSPELILTRKAISRGEIIEIRVRGVRPEAFREASGIKIEVGRERWAIYLGSTLAEDLKLTPGASLQLMLGEDPIEIPVGGVIRTGTPLDYEALINLEDLWSYQPELKGMVSLIRIRMKRPDEEVHLLLESLKAKGLRLVYGQGLSTTLDDLSDQTRRLLYNWSNILYGLTFLTAYILGLRLIQGSGWELTLLRALGLSKRMVFRLALFEVLLVGLLGSTLGLAIGVSGTHIACRLLETAGILKTHLNPSLTADLVLRVLLHTLLSYTIGGLLSMVRLIRMPIARIVR